MTSIEADEKRYENSYTSMNVGTATGEAITEAVKMEGVDYQDLSGNGRVEF